jgi:hypothetical protein
MADSPFVGADGKAPKLVQCAVLYFDLLGVSAMTLGSDPETQLLSFDKTIRRALPYPIGDAAVERGESAYPASVFSDSVVAAVPVESGLPAAQAIFQLVFDAARLQADFAIGKYFARGAITLDRFHFYDGLIFGPAVVEAVELERSVARDPRIIISPAATAALQAARLEGDPYGNAPVLVDEDGVPFVDYLRGGIGADTVLDLTQKLDRHRKVVTERLEEHETNFSRWLKHRWVAEYHNATCLGYRDELADHGGYEDFLITRIHTERAFSALPRPGS